MRENSNSVWFLLLHVTNFFLPDLLADEDPAVLDAIFRDVIADTLDFVRLDVLDALHRPS